MTKVNSKITAALERAKETDAYWVEKAKIDFALQLEDRRRAKKFSYADMARILGKSAAYITKVFRGDANFTIDSMVRLARSTGGQLDIRISNIEVQASKPIYHPSFQTTQLWVGPSAATVLKSTAANQIWHVKRDWDRMAA